MSISRLPTQDADLDRHDEYARIAEAGLEEDAAAELTKLSDGYGNRLRLDHPLATLAAGITRSLVAAGFVIHDCAGRERTGGVCLTPTTTRQPGVIVTWATHDVLAVTVDNYQKSDVHGVMNFALPDVLGSMGFRIDDFGHAGAHLVTGRVAKAGQPL